MCPLVFKIVSCQSNPVQDGWAADLTALLGAKPRRLSRWSELGLWGALHCLRKLPNPDLSATISIRVYSRNGTINATRQALAQIDEHLPMPVTFMQTLPGQLFNAIGTALDWHGDGFTIAGVNRVQAEASMLRNIRQAALLAWVDELPQQVSRWCLLERVAEPDVKSDWESVSSIFETADDVQWLQLSADGKLQQAW